MNKRQKIVQQQFLGNEEAVIKRLKQVYGKSLEDIKGKSQALYDEIEAMSAVYDDIEDEAEKAVLKSRIQSKVYQKQYQDSLKQQVGEILDKMQKEEFKDVSAYLDKCYEDGFVGTMYDLQGQDIPLCFPLDQEAMVRAVQLDSKISQGLYARLGEDVGVLKKKITAQVSRGIATGMTFNQVAQQLSAYTRIGFNNAVRIARTEGHRIQCQSGMDACYKAKEKGADVVKQWDSTLDAKTRESHVQVDGEIRELDEPFSNGLMFPGDPSGGAAEVVHCRCALLQRARWALDKAELETLQERAEFFGIDKSDSFEEFKTKYLKMAEDESAVQEIKNALDFGYGDLTDDDYIKWMDDYDKHNSGVVLSDAELKAIEDYTEGSYISMNAVSRKLENRLNLSAEDLASARKKADALENALSKYDLDTDIVTHRFERDVSWLTGKGNDVADLEKLIGSEYTAKGFTSSGMLPNRFRFTGGKKDAVHFEIVTPKGSNGAFLSMSKKGENEFLYNRNTRFKILGGGERVVKEHKYNFKTGMIDEVDVTERFLKVQVIPEGLTKVAEVPKVATKTSSFVSAKTIGEAEDYISKFVDKNQFGALGVSYSGISVEAANKVNETLSELFETFNLDKLGGVFVAKGNTKLGKAVDGAVAAYSPIRKSLILNNKSLKNVDNIVKEHAEELRLIKLYASDPSSIHFKTKRAELVTKASLKSGRATVPDTIEDVINHEMGHALEKAVSQTDKFEIIKQNMSKYAENISGYATTDISEYIAESFASYRKGEKVIDPDLKGVFDSLKKNAEKTLAKNAKSGIISTDVQQMPKFSSKDIKTVVLPKQEYAHVMSELSTHMSEAQRKQPVVKKAIGDYVYTVENNGFGDYRIIGKKPINGIDISDDEWGD